MFVSLCLGHGYKKRLTLMGKKMFSIIWLSNYPHGKNLNNQRDKRININPHFSTKVRKQTKSWTSNGFGQIVKYDYSMYVIHVIANVKVVYLNVSPCGGI